MTYAHAYLPCACASALHITPRGTIPLLPTPPNHTWSAAGHSAARPATPRQVARTCVQGADTYPTHKAYSLAACLGSLPCSRSHTHTQTNSPPPYAAHEPAPSARLQGGIPRSPRPQRPCNHFLLSSSLPSSPHAFPAGTAALIHGPCYLHTAQDACGAARKRA